MASLSSAVIDQPYHSKTETGRVDTDVADAPHNEELLCAEQADARLQDVNQIVKKPGAAMAEPPSTAVLVKNVNPACQTEDIVETFRVFLVDPTDQVPWQRLAWA